MPASAASLSASRDPVVALDAARRRTARSPGRRRAAPRRTGLRPATDLRRVVVGLRAAAAHGRGRAPVGRVLRGRRWPPLRLVARALLGLAASGPCPRAPGGAGRRSRRSRPSSCRSCAIAPRRWRVAGHQAPQRPSVSIVGPSGGVLDHDAGGGEPVADARRRRRSPCAPGPPAAARAAPPTSASTAVGRSASPPPPAPSAGRAGRGRARRASRATAAERAATRLARRRRRARCCPARTVSCTTASAAGTPRSSSMRGGERRAARSPPASTPPDHARPPRSTKPSIRRKAGRGLVQRLVGELDRRAVVRGDRGSSAARSAAHPLAAPRRPAASCPATCSSSRRRW